MLNYLEKRSARGRGEFRSLIEQFLTDEGIDLDIGGAGLFRYPPHFGILNTLAKPEIDVGRLQGILFDFDEQNQSELKLTSNEEIVLPNIGTLKCLKDEITIDGTTDRLDALQSEGHIQLSRNHLIAAGRISVLAGCDPFIRESISGSGEGCEFLAPTRDVMEKFEEAVAMIEELSPQMYGIIFDHVRYLVVFRGDPNAPSYADLAYQGAIFINLDRTTTVPALASDILHQTAHVFLTMATFDSDALFLIPAEEQIGSLLGGKDRRPLYGAFHGLFTAYVEAEFCSLWLKRAKDLAHGPIGQMTDLLQNKMESFQRDLQIFRRLEREGILTPDGNEILKQYDSSKLEIVL